MKANLLGTICLGVITMIAGYRNFGSKISAVNNSSEPTQTMVAEVSQEEARRLLSLGGSCSEPDAIKAMEEIYEDQKAHYKNGGRKYKSLRQSQQFSWSDEYKYSPRKLYLASKRLELRSNLRTQIFRNAVDLYKRMAINDMDGTSFGLELPKSCSVIRNNSPKQWYEIQDLVFDANRAKSKLLRIQDKFQDSYVELLLMAAYEIMVIEKIYLTNAWKKVPFWHGDQELDRSIVFPPIFPDSLFSNQLQFASERLKKIYFDFPILKRVDHYKIGYPKYSLAQMLFEKFFLSKGNSIDQQLKQDLAPGIEKSLKLAYYSNSKFDADSPLDSLYLKAHFIFLRSQIQQMGAVKVREIASLGRNSNQIEEIIQSEFDEWNKEAYLAMDMACQEPEAYLEQLSSLTFEFFLGAAREQNSSIEDGEEPYQNPTDRFDLFDAYCNSGWGKTVQSQFETYSVLGAGGAFLVAAAFPPTTVVALPAAIGMSVGGFLTGAYQTHQAMAVERSLGLLGYQQQRSKARMFVGQGLGAILSASLLKLALGGIHKNGAGKYFVPFFNFDAKTKKMKVWTKMQITTIAAVFASDRAIDAVNFLDEGKNPLVSNRFWQNTGVGAINFLFFGKSLTAKGFAAKMKGVGIATAVSLAVNHYVQSLNFATIGIPLNYDILTFEAMWNTGIAAPRTAALFGAYTMLDYIGRRTGASFATSVVSIALTIGQSAGSSYFYWPSRTNYVEGKDFFSHLYEYFSSVEDSGPSISKRDWDKLYSLIEGELSDDQTGLLRISDAVVGVSNLKADSDGGE